MIVKLTDRCYELVSPKTEPSGNPKDLNRLFY